uniref:Lymphotoxin-alpha n=1 Tax=Xenopus tropicalis TaxID=8364 RepID=A0A6I8SSF6_XENTR
MFLSRMIRVPKRLLLRGHLIGALLTFLCIICPASGNQIKFKDTTNRKPAAHLEANPFIKNSLNWRSDLDNSFICCGLLLNNNTLHITKNGLYFVYTQATFSGNTCLEGDSIFLSHSVVLDSKQFAEKTSLLSAQKTACKTSVLWSRSIFLGGTFALENGDILYTVTQGQNHLALYPGEAYFGLYAL